MSNGVGLAELIYVIMESLFLSLVVLSLHTVAGFRVYPPVDASDPRTPLYFGLIQGLNGSSGFQSPGAVAGVEVALDRINSDATVLPGYSLHYVLTNAECNRTLAIQALFQQFLSDPVRVAILGSGCSIATEPTAEISPTYNVTQISCIASSTELANRIQFQNYFQILPTEADIAPGYFGVIRQYGWRHVALIVQNENLFTVTMNRLKRLLRDDGIQFSEQVFPSGLGVSALGPQPFDPRARIFVFAMFSEHARQLLCEAYRRGYRYPRYLFLTYRWYLDNWWLMGDERENLTCSPEERESVLPLMLAFLHFPYLEFEGLDVTTDTGITGNQYLAEESDHVMIPPLYLFSQEGGYFCYDAMWTLAYTLRQTMEDFADDSTLSKEAWQAVGIHSNDTFTLENFTYDNTVVLDRMRNNMADTNFTGLTGLVSFGEDGIRNVFVLRVFQYRFEEVNGLRELDWFQIAEVDADDYTFSYLEGESDERVWPRGIPYDGVPEEQDVSVSLGLTVVFSFSATAGIIFALVCLTFNFYFRKKTLIRLSSPNLNTLIGVGAIVLYVDLYLVVVPTTDPTAVAVLCNLTPWFTAIGYSLCYGTILVKMGRVYYIFSNPTARKKKSYLRDWVLGACVGVMVGLDLVILVGYTAVEGGRNNLGAERIPNKENREDIEGDLGIITRYFVWICDSNARDIFLGFLYGYKALLQVVALLLAFRTRRVKVKGLNDAKEIAGAIYVTSIVLAMVVVATYTLNERINAFAALFCTGFFIGTTFILLLVFVPKMVALYQDPEGEEIFRKVDSSQMGSLSPSTFSSIQNNRLSAPVLDEPDREGMESLRRRVKELEARLSQYQAVGDMTNDPDSYAQFSDISPPGPESQEQDESTRC